MTQDKATRMLQAVIHRREIAALAPEDTPEGCEGWEALDNAVTELESILADPDPSPSDFAETADAQASVCHALERIAQWLAELALRVPSPQDLACSREIAEMLGRTVTDPSLAKALQGIAESIIARHTDSSRRFVVVEVTDQLDGILEHGDEDRSFQRDLFDLFCDAYRAQYPQAGEVGK